MAYAFKQIEAHDPSNPGLVAPNASVTIFEPGDPAKTPLTLTRITGEPLPNPVTVNGLGYGPAFMHATLPQVAWSGGGLTGTFESYEGMRDEAIAARTAAETAAANAAVEAAAAIGDATVAAEAAADAADASALAAANSAALVGAPADNAIATAINATGSATKTALAATYGPAAAGMKEAFAPVDTVALSNAGTYGPQFVKQGTVQLTQANSGLASIYWPYVVNVEHVAGALGKFYMYYSTDHDLGAGGVKMAYANSPTGPWTRHPTFVYTDTVEGDQTETPTVVWNETTSKFHMYYQQEGTGLNQSTYLATSPDGITWTRVGMVLKGIVNIPGDGQTTYIRVFRFGGQWFAYHLFGGGNYGHGGVSYSHDGITWVTDPRRLGFSNDLLGDTTQRIDLFHAVPFMWRGEVWALAQMGPHAGGFVIGGAKWVLGRLATDMRGWRGTPRQIFATLPAGETETNGPTCVLVDKGKIYTYYRANGAQGDFRVAVAEA